MDINKAEVAAVQAAAAHVAEVIQELDELELSLVGGGSGDIVFV